MHSCEVVYKDILKRLTVENSFWERCNAVGCCEAYRAPQKLLLHHQCLFLEGGSGIATSIFAHQGGQYFDYGLKSMHSPWIIQFARPKIIHTLLTLIFRR